MHRRTTVFVALSLISALIRAASVSAQTQSVDPNEVKAFLASPEASAAASDAMKRLTTGLSEVPRDSQPQPDESLPAQLPLGQSSGVSATLTATYRASVSDLQTSADIKTWGASTASHALARSGEVDSETMRKFGLSSASIDLRLDQPTADRLQPNDTVSLSGVLNGGDDKTRPIMWVREAKTVSRAKSSGTGNDRLLVIPIYFDADTPHPWSGVVQDYFNDTYMNPMVLSSSYGNASITSDVVSAVRVPHRGTAGSVPDCDLNDTMIRARAAAIAAGVNVGAYARINFVLKHQPCGWQSLLNIGLAQVGGDFVMNDMWLWAFIGYGTTDHYKAWSNTTFHELGHTWGLMHADAWTCSHPVIGVNPMLGPCTSIDYGNPLNLMARAGAAGARDRHYMNWLSSSQLFTKASSATAATGSVTLTPIETNTPGLKGARFTVSGREYWFEFRQPVAEDQLGPTSTIPPTVFDGVMMTEPRPIAGFPNGTGTWDFHPETPRGPGTEDTWAYDARLGLNEIAGTPEGASFQLTALSSSSATINYTLPGAAPTAPTAATTPSVYTTSGLLWVTNASVANWGTASPGWFRVNYQSTDGAVVGSTIRSANSMITLSDLPRGRSYSMSLTPINTAGQVGPTSASSVPRLSYDNPSGTATFTETNGGQFVGYTVNIPQASVAPVTRTIYTVNGTATSTNDFFPITSATITIPAGATSAWGLVVLRGDTIHEPTEQFSIRFNDPDQIFPAPSTNRIMLAATILDND